MMVELKERDFEAFFQAPFNAYGPDSFYVSPLKGDLKNFLTAGKNPLFSTEADFTYLSAHANGKVVGRIVAHVHRASNSLYKTNRAYFGFFDCADHPAAAALLLRAAEKWARDNGFDEIMGNFNLTIAQQIGVMTEGFEHPPYIDMVYNPPHIPRLLLANGYEAFFPVSTAQGNISHLSEDQLLGPNQSAVLNDPDFEWRPINRRTLKKCLADAHTLLNDAFAKNAMFVPLTTEEFAFQTASLGAIIDPRIATVVYYKGKPAGAVICMPDLNPLLKKIGSRMGLAAIYHFLKYRFTRKRAVIIYYAVASDLHSRGINGAMVYRVLKSLKQAGYTEVGGTWISDENLASLRTREKMHIQPMHRLNLYRKQLTPV